MCRQGRNRLDEQRGPHISPGKTEGVLTVDHLYSDNVTEISLSFPWRGSLTDDDEGLEPTIVRSMD
ncbi:hypothetical protein GCM10010178_84970 [Lentzea flava]|uniref:Uncharacterized protein n=1 Tax=Lentzea flava TaxID=103732 RepID=A0ABQ2VFH8_9PSEU|nr:hypothetical protein GCM10010178_84970 [Lentzea flava]